MHARIKEFIAGKKPHQDVFETLTPTILNKHLSSIMKGLSAKVFRTYNASFTLEEQLPSPEAMAGLTIQEKVTRYNAANREVAILCNHQKTVSKAAEAQLESLNEGLSLMTKQVKEMKRWIRLINEGKEGEIPLREDDTAKVTYTFFTGFEGMACSIV